MIHNGLFQNLTAKRRHKYKDAGDIKGDRLTYTQIYNNFIIKQYYPKKIVKITKNEKDSNPQKLKKKSPYDSISNLIIQEERPDIDSRYDMPILQAEPVGAVNYQDGAAYAHSMHHSGDYEDSSGNAQDNLYYIEQLVDQAEDSAQISESAEDNIESVEDNIEQAEDVIEQRIS